MLRLPIGAYAAILGHAYDGLPDEACGLLVGRPASGVVVRYEPCRNAAGSARVYTIDPRDQLRIERRADDDDLEVLGVVHSHTHTDPVPSPTDIAQAPDPSWHYVIVSLRDEAPMLRSWRIVEDAVTEEKVAVTA
ncbi:MAG: M67 family metallopeptidase [Actinomycetota bacterium]|nr:M67 family metallopeptidase [Acidimicrobiia bacterium]MDQ3293005.1 M67 family metallopeptidase [Actinomycetota bacterium]